MDEYKEIENYLPEFTEESIKAYRKDSMNRTCIAFTGISWEELRFLNEMAMRRIEKIESNV